MEQDVTARIHSFESFGTVDGPGIRFVIFMQGCSLKCKYCHNRDTWDLCGGMKYSLNEVVFKIKRYKNYFMPSGGGVTVSGGEPLLQIDFLIELFKELKKLGIHTAVDTSGNFEITDKVKEIIDLTDLFLLDIKLSLIHISFTYNLYPKADGTLPLEVCGLSKYPHLSNSAISFLIVALL